MAEHLQIQWSLNHTFDLSIAVARSIFSAATHDNIQPLAILACEKFGATLAICLETSRRVETLVVRAPQMKMVNFVKASVGFKEDSATQLCQSLAGTQFLALAASMLETMGPFQASLSLEQMLCRTAADKTLVPTARQLKDLLTVLEPRLGRSGFGDGLHGWHIFLSNSYKNNITYRSTLEDFKSRPSNTGMAQIVDCFRQMSRIGDASYLIFKAQNSIPWLAAFTKWCLGAPPSISLENGTSIINQPESRVSIIVRLQSEVESSKLEILICRNLDSPVDLIIADTVPLTYTGMVGIETYGRWLIQKSNLTTEDDQRVLLQALPHASMQVVSLLRPSGSGGIASYTPPIKYGSSSLAPKCFPEIPAIVRTLKRLLDLEKGVSLPSPEAGLLVSDLPLVGMVLRDLKTKCCCSKCNGHRIQDESVHLRGLCIVDKWKMNLARFAAEALALSLFEHSESLLVDANAYQPENNSFEIAVYSILWKGLETGCTINDILRYATTRVGQSKDVLQDISENQWVMSCCKGQAVYPALLASEDIYQTGYLRLSWAYGKLQYGDEYFSRVCGVSSSNTTGREIPSLVAGATRNLCPDYTFTWQVAPKDTHLQVSLVVLSSNEAMTTLLVCHPFLILEGLASALVVGNCHHGEHCGLDAADRFCTYLDPINLHNDQGFYVGQEAEGTAIERIRIVPVVGNARQRMAALSSPLLYPLTSSNGYGCVLNQHACLQCSLDVCRMNEVSVLIC
ncbi:MAG: hypothetical protein HETSPECPRED_000606 [Heterodermia speciosa]|uniref:Uncharacterized protein n=1 Tax=Heterodermia speciosa TaxID=116794 RepID=A0A8H3GAI8_9LECA|nr:MAG: hypothetical protein HETSPECPRED_000606 [Heterodermia speciosa]